jgi:hypothetical protein
MDETRRYEFLSEEDIDLRNLSQEELDAWWWEWFQAAQATNDLDDRTYSHGVFVRIREPRPGDVD